METGPIWYALCFGPHTFAVLSTSAGRVVFCTGGAGTICSAQVRALVYLGADACIVGRNAEKTEAMARSIATARAGARVLGLGAVDVRRPEALAAAAERCVAELGGIDVAIAGAAGNFLAPLTQLSANAFKSVMDIDVLGSYNTVKATLPALAAAAERARATGGPGPRLIFVSATLHYTGTLLQAHVGAAKAAVDALAVSCAIELGPRGITSNAIAPGAVKGTEGIERLATKEYLQEQERTNPTGRIATVRDIADATVFLCGAAAGHINGATIVGESSSPIALKLLQLKLRSITCDICSGWGFVESSLGCTEWDATIPRFYIERSGRRRG